MPHMKTPNSVLPRVIHHLDLDARWFPKIVLDAPSTFDLQTLRDEFMLNDGVTASEQYSPLKSLSSVSTARTSARFSIEVFDTQARASQIPAVMQMPRLKAFYKRPNPCQIYDLAAVKFKSNQSSRLWLSTAITAKSNYFLNMARVPIAHAAATKGSALLHSALVEHEGIGILLPGSAFSGKSSIAMFAMLSGATLIGDDLVLISTVGKGATAARSFRKTLLMRERTHNLLPEHIRAHAQSASLGGVTKYSYNRDKLGSLTSVETNLQRIVLPSISKSALKNVKYGYQLRTIDKSSTIQQLARCLDSSVLMPGLESEKSKVMAGLLNLVARTPCIALCMDSRFLDAPEENCRKLLNDIVSMTNSLSAVDA